MKRRTAILMIAALILIFAGFACAEETTGRGAPVARSESLAAYLDGNGNLYLPGNAQPVNAARADSIISIDPYRLIFLSKTSDASGAEKTALVYIDLSTFKETTVDSNVHAACMSEDGKLYFIPADSRTRLHMLDFDTNLISIAYTAFEQLDRLYASADGLVVTYVENAGAVAYNAAKNAFETYTGSIPSQSTLADGYQLYIADGSDLYLLRSGAFAADLIDANVYDYTLLNETVYYLANMGSAVRLKSYNPATMEWKVLSTPDVSLNGQLASSQSQLFALGSDRTVYSVDLTTGDFTPYLTLKADSQYEAIPTDGSWSVDGYEIEAMSGQLNVYALLTQADAAPSFTFVENETDAADDSASRIALLETVSLSNETLAWDLLKPAPSKSYTTLRRGSRGDAVKDIQQPLYDLGYYDYYIDGIFGVRTERAIRLLQGDLGLTVDGIADESLQKRILSGTLSAYDPYVALSRGDRGLRVEELQTALREYGYLADAADGIFGRRTQAAVQLFQRENGLNVSDDATRETLRTLYSSSAAYCSSYIDLRKGDTGYRVLELNKRLKALFYLEGSAGSTYTSATASAVKKFQEQAGLTITGQATSAVQQRLFAKNAPEYNGYVTLQRGDENARVTQLQDRLRELGYFSGSSTGYFGKVTQNSVKLFQLKAGMRPNGVASVEMQELLYSPSAPAYIAPTVLGTPTLSISSYARIEDGVYCVNENSSFTGSITLGWYAEGDVDYYNVLIVDDKGDTCLNQNTQMELTSVSVGALSLDRTYTLTVTAYPMDGDSSHITRAALRFKRVSVEPDPTPVIGTITGISASVEPLARMEDDVYYLHDGEFTMRWYATGDLASYYVEVIGPKGDLCMRTSTSDEQAKSSTNNMKAGEIYTLNVYAIPTNGTISDAVLKTIRFALDDTPASVPEVAAPSLSIEGVLPDDSGVYTLEETGATLHWDAVENAAQYFIEVRDASNALFSSVTTTATGYVVNPSAMARGAVYSISVTAIPEGGTAAQGKTSSVKIVIRKDETVATLDAPAFSIEGSAPAEDGVVYLSNPQITFVWSSVEGADGYNFSIRSDSEPLYTQTVTDTLSVQYDASSLVGGKTYTASVTAVPAEGSDAQGTPATLPFAIQTEIAQFAATLSQVEQPTEEVATDEPFSEPTDAPAVSEPAETPSVSITSPASVEDETYFVEGGTVAFEWYAQNADSYYVEIIDTLASDTGIVAKLTTSETGASVPSDKLAEDRAYMLNVTAYNSDGQPSETASLCFARKVAESPVEEPTDVPAAESTPESPAYEEVTEEPNDEPTDEPSEAPAIGSVSAPVLDIQPITEIADDVCYVSEGGITFDWYAEGDVAGYVARIYDSTGTIVAETQSNGADITTTFMTPGTIYTLKVIAVPVNGTEEDGVVSELCFALASTVTETEPTPEAAEESTPEPTEEPTPEPTEEPTPEPTVEPTPEPTEEPTPEPTVEPTPEPTVEPTPDPTEEPSQVIEWIDPIDADSDPERIMLIQRRLAEWGWLKLDAEFTIGELDEATLQAVCDFQTYYNETLFGTLTVVDLEAASPAIDVDTLQVLMTDDAAALVLQPDLSAPIVLQ